MTELATPLLLARKMKIPKVMGDWEAQRCVRSGASSVCHQCPPLRARPDIAALRHSVGHAQACVRACLRAGGQDKHTIQVVK